MSDNLNILLAKALDQCENQGGIALIKKVLTESVTGVPNTVISNRLSSDLLEKIDIKIQDLPDGCDIGEDLVHTAKVIREEIIMICSSYMQTKLNIYSSEISRELLDPESYGKELMAKIIVICSSKICIAEYDIGSAISEAMNYIEPLYNRSKDKYGLEEGLNLIPFVEEYTISFLRNVVILFQDNFLESMNNDTTEKSYHRTVLGFHKFLEELQVLYKRILEVN